MLTPTYDLILVSASIAVSIMSSFTGLVLTRGISALPDAQRKLRIVMGAAALGGGIWSMHFVAMLAMNLPIPVSYDATYTLGSALIAILMSGVAFLILHYAGRTRLHIAVAGAILGNGIVAMHYVGMSGIRGCLAIFVPTGVILAIAGATAMGIVALHMSYAVRTTIRVFAGAVTFGLAVVLVHFVAMNWTGFESGFAGDAVTPLIDHGMLALLVMLSAFVICGMFLLTATNFVFAGAVMPPHAVASDQAGAAAFEPELEPAPVPAIQPENTRLPYERDKRIHFIGPESVAAIRAEGHYSILYTAEEKLFCPLSISAVEKRLPQKQFMRTHRSYIVNMSKVAAFERRKDNGLCLFDGVTSLEAAPVSRSFVPVVRSALGI